MSIVGASGLIPPLDVLWEGCGRKETMPAVSAAIRLHSADALEDIVPVGVTGRPDIGTATSRANHDGRRAASSVDGITSVPLTRGVPRVR